MSNESVILGPRRILAGGCFCFGFPPPVSKLLDARPMSRFERCAVSSPMLAVPNFIRLLSIPRQNTVGNTRRLYRLLEAKRPPGVVSIRSSSKVALCQKTFRTAWRPILMPREMKQKSISSFFGAAGRSKTSSGENAGALNAAKSGSGSEAVGKLGANNGKSDQSGSTAQAKTTPKKGTRKRASETKTSGSAGARKLKRLRKVEEEAKAASEAESMEDTDLEDSPFKPKSKSPKKSPKKRKAASSENPQKDNSKEVKGKKGDDAEVVAVSEPAGSDQIASDMELGSESEAESVTSGSEKSEIEIEAGEKSPSKKGKKATKTKKSPKKKSASSARSSKVEGVGQGALAAATQHLKFDPNSAATWEAGEKVPYKFLTDTFDKIGETTKRLEIAKLLTDAFRVIIATTPEDLLPAVYLCVNCVGPAHEGLELGVGDAILIKALVQSVGKNEAAIKKEYERTGDLGTVAVANRSTQRTLFKAKPLTLAGVLKAFLEVAQAQGGKSQDRKKEAIVKLLVASKKSEAGYVMRSLQGKLRIGLAEQTVLVALAHAVLLQRDGQKDEAFLADNLEKASQAVKQAYGECPSYDKLIPVLLEHGTSDLSSHLGFTPGVPIRPMLAKPTNGISEVLDKFSDVEFTCEYKYDGERAQVHVLEGGEIRIYSRNAEDSTPKFPDIVQRIPEHLNDNVTSVVLDCEAVAYDPGEKRILPFQVLSTRPRKDVSVESIKVRVCVFCFDCLYLNGQSLLRKNLTQRREALYSALTPEEGKLQFAKAETSKDIEELQRFLDEAVDDSTEGLIVKTLDATYEPSKRSLNWLKLKKDYMDGVGDTFDVVPIGAWHGKGKRTGCYGSYLLAVYDPDGEEYQTISKIGTGFSEEELVKHSEELKQHAIDTPKMYYSYGETLIPDVWFEPKIVWEVKAADLSVSPVHQAARGLVDQAKGISIRFPRLIRVRDDKTPEEATSAQQVAEMYEQQNSVKSRKSGRSGKSEEG